jgi:hypothetical protein
MSNTTGKSGTAFVIGAAISSRILLKSIPLKTGEEIL